MKKPSKMVDDLLLPLASLDTPTPLQTTTALHRPRAIQGPTDLGLLNFLTCFKTQHGGAERRKLCILKLVDCVFSRGRAAIDQPTSAARGRNINSGARCGKVLCIFRVYLS